MIRTIEEMEKDDKLEYQDYGLSLSDTLAFCIVASDYLRARRRRYPLALEINLITSDRDIFDDNECDDTTFNYSGNWSFNMLVTRAYAITDKPRNTYYLLWDYRKEYIEWTTT